MQNTYYHQTFHIPMVDEKDRLIGQVERWEAHRKAILHRGFTVILIYQGKFILQHRKHPAFDKTWDLTFSSHAIYKNNKLQSNHDAIYDALEREWHLLPRDLIGRPLYKGKVYYQAKDPASIYSEHEFDYIYQAELSNLPKPNSDYAYGYQHLNTVTDIAHLPATYTLAPWVRSIIKEIF